MLAKDVHFIDDHEELVGNPKLISELRERILDGHTYIAKGVYEPALLDRIKSYLIDIGRHSLPNYQKIEVGCSNFHRLNDSDERAFVKGCFHQFAFFPWNQDCFRFFELFKQIYIVKNLLSNKEPLQFLGNQPDQGCIARLAVQLYPQGAGYLNKHQDPVDHHQLVVPTLVMSAKGEDYQEGGAYIESESGELIMTDELAGVGGVVYFNANIRHGVLPIDEKKELDWLSFQGRWMLLFAVNKLFDTQSVGNSVDMEN